jgi:hypothetical protein
MGTCGGWWVGAGGVAADFARWANTPVKISVCLSACVLDGAACGSVTVWLFCLGVGAGNNHAKNARIREGFFVTGCDGDGGAAWVAAGAGGGDEGGDA